MTEREAKTREKNEEGKTDGQTTVYAQEGQSDRDRREQEGSQEGRTRPRASQKNRVTESDQEDRVNGE